MSELCWPSIRRVDTPDVGCVVRQHAMALPAAPPPPPALGQEVAALVARPDLGSVGRTVALRTCGRPPPTHTLSAPVCLSTTTPVALNPERFPLFATFYHFLQRVCTSCVLLRITQCCCWMGRNWLPVQIDLGREIHSYDVRLTLLIDDDDDDDDDDTIAGALGGLSVGGCIPSVSAARFD
jgi:hypothetical protein